MIKMIYNYFMTRTKFLIYNFFMTTKKEKKVFIISYCSVDKIVKPNGSWYGICVFS